MPKNPTILNLHDLDAVFWRDITVDRFEKFKSVFMTAANALWVTWGTERDNGDGAMTVGFFRSLAYELPQAVLQIIDLENPEMADATFIAERLLRVEIASHWNRIGSFRP